MTTPGSYDASIMNVDLDKELQRLHLQVLLSWKKEARTLGWFGLNDQMSVLELGSGPGFYTEQLLNLLPNSQITALEIDPVLVKQSQQYLQNKADHRLQIIEASVMETGLPDNSFDFVIARLVLEHISNPPGAFKEALRVLKPGGKLVIIGGDRNMMMLIDPLFPEFDLINEKAAQFQINRGGDPFLGRKLWRILQTAGFENLDLETIAYHSDDVGIEAISEQFQPEHFLHLASLGMLSAQEAENTIAAMNKFLNSENPFILILGFMACGQKPYLNLAEN
jgi:ubiquinone/menaquinone biosynthesis C-methylase UbiE